MQKFIYKIFQIVLWFQHKTHKRKLEKSQTTFRTASNVISFNSAAELKFNSKSDDLKIELDEEIKNIVKQNLDNPQALLDFVKEQNTPVYRIPYVDKILSVIREDEGFIAPLSGLKALYLNLVIGIFAEKRILFSIKTQGMFVLRPVDVDIYSMIHQFHKWYSYKNNLPGFEADSQQNFKKVFRTLRDEDIRDFSLGEIISIKEALARDVEAIDFVVGLAKEVDSTQKIIKKIKAGQRVSL